MQKVKKIKLLSLSALLFVATSVGALAGSVGTASAASCTSYAYRYGAKGACVQYIQMILNSASQSASTCNGYRDSTAILATDGSFGPLTKSRVIEFQKSRCLVGDGSVGPLTWEKLCYKGSQAGYIISGPGWYDPTNTKDVYDLAAYKASVWAGCSSSVSWPHLMNY